MIKVVIFGSGNVATHLTRAFIKAKDVNLVQVYSRTIENILYLTKKVAITDSLKKLKDADIYIIAISDDAISDFSKELILNDKLVVHTSGSVKMNDLNSESNKGVFYPLQTFSTTKKISFKKVPICIESERKEDLIILEKLGSSISKNVYLIDSKQRQKLHLAAVFVNNFVNHLYTIGNKICQDNKVPFQVLQPLIKETADKVQHINPKEAQTGPAQRNDQSTIAKHLSQLDNNQKEIYKILTDSIKKSHN
ncbi:Rossmann-like and DUF2520 domain-containing protein [Urechidicola croceus]|uniref:DUF2520 domain-containing protein n=1 Tax=Urechidicola croceus TaxID=1850246 RepID=A0A1D8P4J1_9FLAO|nr:Rossmann-like and DUF2520 domain-containing protein [Urechidicola croceus]AOW19477.1 hypothetical protein LPB138_01700 [Urechidicola croceus]